MQDLSSYRDTSRAINQWKELCFERWKYDHVRNEASQGANNVAEDHFKTSASSEAPMSWLDVYDIKSEEAKRTAAAAAHRNSTTLRSSSFSWLDQLKLAHDLFNAKSWFYFTITHHAFKEWRNQFKLRCSRLESFQSHIKLSYPAVYHRLDVSSPMTLWPT